MSDLPEDPVVAQLQALTEALEKIADESIHAEDWGADYPEQCGKCMAWKALGRPGRPDA